MLSRCFTLLSILCGVSLLLNAVQAATSVDGTRLGNSTIERTVQLRTHSLFPPYIDEDLQNRWWDFGADSNTNKHIRLTRGVPSQMGWLWSRLPLSATNYVIEVEFKISGESTHLFGDGMAIWLTTERTQPGPVFGNQDKFNGLGIFLDTYANSRHSYAFPRSIGDCSANYRRTNVATKLKISYVKDKFLDPNLFSLGSSESSGTWLGFFFKLFAFAGLCVGGYYGYLEYLRRQRYAGAGNFGMGGRGGGGGFGGMYSNNKRF
ncbi:concanavalin A-like lectin/glucanase domain-containing protein [Infundibulicybe gibba]|nr:concanavalin A-like lectin/glucanase domain-containing protein [Infundibulicybe gibba]